MIGDAYDRSDALNLGHPEYARAAVLAGLGYAVLPRLSVAAELESGALKQLPGRSGVRAIRAVRRRALGGPALEQFWKLLEEEASKTPASPRAQSS
jgi:DNA-binding transcriptional LysR family regulator